MIPRRLFLKGVGVTPVVSSVWWRFLAARVKNTYNDEFPYDDSAGYNRSPQV
jgi:hypothetical protein